jgi:DNA-binding transcriptional LysR family regulator
MYICIEFINFLALLWRVTGNRDRTQVSLNRVFIGEFPKMEFIQLLSFHQIVKTGSFSKASEGIFRSQSAVSHQIKNLETELKVKLFKRLGKGIELTEEGKILFDAISAFLGDLENIKRIYEDKDQSGRLIIATSSAIITYSLPHAVSTFVAQFPKVNLKLITCNATSEIQSMLLNEDADFGIGPKSEHSIPKKLNFVSWRAFPKVLLAPRGHPLSRKKTVELADIVEYPLILYREGLLRRAVEETFIQNNLSYRIIMEMDVAENIKKYVEQGIGLSILSSFTVDQEKDRFALFGVDHLFKRTEYGIYYRRDKYITTLMKQFIKYFAPELIDKLHSYPVR